MGVAPWALARQSLWWTFAALDFERAEARAQEIADEIAERRRKGDSDDDDSENECDD